VLQATDCGAPRICFPWMIGAPAATCHYARPDPRPPSAARSKSADVPGLIRVRPARSESVSVSGVPHSPVCSSHDRNRSSVHYLKGVRGYRAIAWRRWRSRRRRRPAAPPGTQPHYGTDSRKALDGAEPPRRRRRWQNFPGRPFVCSA
jgi:hypothetical protein